METVQFEDSELQDSIELSKQAYFTILLDENLRSLEAGLEDTASRSFCRSRV